jgi:hypothetical protein
MANPSIQGIGRHWTGDRDPFPIDDRQTMYGPGLDQTDQVRG